MKRIQMIGTQRSGSNLLRVMLHQHPDISAPHPPHLLKTFYPLLSHYGDLSVERNFSRLVDDMIKWVKLNPVIWEGFNPTVEEIVSGCSKRTIFQISKSIYDWEASFQGKSVWVCKSMTNYEFVNQFESEKIFDHYIFLYRDGRDVALSFQKAIVGPKTAYYCAKQWSEDQLASLKVRDQLGKKVISASYEELIEQPLKVVQRIFHEMGMRAPKDVLSFPDSEESKHTADAGEMWKNVTKPVISSNKLKWVNEMPYEDQLIYKSVAGEALRALGYQTLSYTDVVPDAFSASQIAEIELREKQLREEARRRTPKKDLDLRRGQDEFLQQLKRYKPA